MPPNARFLSLMMLKMMTMTMTMTMTMLMTMMMVVVFLPESSATHRTPRTEGVRETCSHQTPKLSEPVVISCSSCKNHSLDLRRVNSDKTCSKLSNSGKDSADPIVALVSRIWALKGKIYKCTFLVFGCGAPFFEVDVFVYRGWLGCKHCAIAIVVQCCLNEIILKNFSKNNFKSQCNVL